MLYHPPDAGQRSFDMLAVVTSLVNKLGISAEGFHNASNLLRRASHVNRVLRGSIKLRLYQVVLFLPCLLINENKWMLMKHQKHKLTAACSWMPSAGTKVFGHFLPLMEHLSRVTDLACRHHLGRNEEPDFKMSCPLIGGGVGQRPNRTRQNELSPDHSICDFSCTFGLGMQFLSIFLN